MIGGKTKTGFSFEVDEKMLNDWRLTKALVKMQDTTNTVERFKGVDEALTLLLGDKVDDLMDHLIKKNKAHSEMLSLFPVRLREPAVRKTAGLSFLRRNVRAEQAVYPAPIQGSAGGLRNPGQIVYACIPCCVLLRNLLSDRQAVHKVHRRGPRRCRPERLMPHKPGIPVSAETLSDPRRAAPNRASVYMFFRSCPSLQGRGQK